MSTTNTKRRRSGVRPLLWIGWGFAFLVAWSYCWGRGLPGGWLWALAVVAVGVPVGVPLLRAAWRLVRLIRGVDAAQVAVVHRARPMAGVRR